jgi:Domain of unknown function (DUF4823)
MRRALGVLIMSFLAGCSATYSRQIVKEPTTKLERDRGVFISTPKDGWYGRIQYKNSGKMTAAAIKAAFSRYSNSVYVSEECLGSECLKIIPATKFAYYIEPEILHWEDRATEWSGIPDKITIKISVYDAALGSGIASAVFDGESKWATFGGDHPQDLLPEPVNQYVDSLY